MKFYCLIGLLLSANSAWAAGVIRSSFDQARVGLTQQNYTGPSKSSFSDGSPAYGLEIAVDNGNSYFRYFFKARFNTSTGSQNFIKGTTTYFSKYEYMSFEPEIGGAFFPIARNDKGLNIYLWAVGTVSYNYLVLKNVPNTVNVDAKDQQFGTGYGGGLGFEYVLSTSGSRGKSKSSGRLSLYSEIGFRTNYASLAGQNDFQVSGMTISLGMGF